MQLARIHFWRVGKGETLYLEPLVDETPVRIITHTRIPPEHRQAWASGPLGQHGILSPGSPVCAVRKHHFFEEWFDILELFGEEDSLIGYYCDVITPLRKEDQEYILCDLLLDLWIYPDGRTLELDWDEFEQAARDGLITPDEHTKAVETLRWMVAQVQQGMFPGSYLE